LQEAATEYGFLELDNIVEIYMEEGIRVQMPYALRHLFATLLIFSRPPNAKDVWSKYYRHLSEDFQYITENNNEAWILHQTVTAV